MVAVFQEERVLMYQRSKFLLSILLAVVVLAVGTAAASAAQHVCACQRSADLPVRFRQL